MAPFYVTETFETHFVKRGHVIYISFCLVLVIKTCFVKRGYVLYVPFCILRMLASISCKKEACAL